MGLQVKNDSKIFLDYADYLAYQTEHARSFEGKIPKYAHGQKEYIRKKFSSFDRKLSILDCACGDGTGLRCFKSLGFKNVIGVELCPEKIHLANRSGFKIFNEDMHKLLSIFHPSSFDIIYSSHSLEHAFDPDKVVRNFWELLGLFGRLFVVLPYPDNINDKHRRKAHCGSKILGLDRRDQGTDTSDFFTKRGFALRLKEFNSQREAEIWLELEKI